MDKTKIAITAMMVLSVLVLLTGTLGIGGATTELFEQPPATWFMTYSIYDPDFPADILVYENFWGVTGDICDLHWYGLSVNYSNQSSCDPEGMIFEITFYANNATGMPGAVVCSYENVSPRISYYGEFFGFGGYLFETDLNPCCQLRDGWVSIQSQGSDNGCWFSWLSSSAGDGNALREDRINNKIDQILDHAFTLTGKAEVPALTPTGLIALVGMLSAIAAVAVVRKRR